MKLQELNAKNLKDTAYFEALQHAVSIRLDRKKLYGDGFLTSKDRFFMVMLEEKLARATHMFDNATAGNYEKIEDTLLDIVNYSLMWLQVLGNRNKK